MAHGVEMRLHAELYEGMLPRTQPRKIRKGAKSEVHHDGRQHGRQEGYKGLHRAAGRDHTNAGEGTREDNQTQIRAPHGAQIQIPCRPSQHAHHKHEGQRGQQCGDGHRPSAEEFGQNHLPLGQGARQKQLKRPCTMLLRKRTHRDGGNEKHEHPRSHGKKRIQSGHAPVQNVPSSGKEPQEQTREEQEHRNHGVAEQRAEKTPDFFEDKCAHESRAKDSLYPASPTS